MIIDKQDFLTWAKSKDPKETYQYTNPCGCAVARYLKAKGFQFVQVGPDTFKGFDGNDYCYGTIPHEFVVALSANRTFGGLLEDITEKCDAGQ